MRSTPGTGYKWLSATGTAKSEAFGGRPFASPCPKPFGRFGKASLDRTGPAVPLQVPLFNWLAVAGVRRALA